MATDVTDLAGHFGLAELEAGLQRIRGELRSLFEPDVALAPPPREPRLRLDSDEGLRAERVLDLVIDEVVRHSLNVRHPCSIAHMVPPPASISVAGDLLVGALNQCAFIQEEGPSTHALEKQCLEWLALSIGMETGYGAQLTSGGTVNNLVAAYLARCRARARGILGPRPCVLASDQAHFSVDKAAALLGLERDAVVRVGTVGGRLERGALTRAFEAAVARGRSPFLVVCTAGTTNAGVLEEPEEFLEAAHASGAWCHVDAAHGGAQCLLRPAPPGVALWRRADSVSWDPHKTLFATYSIGALLVTDSADLLPMEFRSEYALRNGNDADAGLLHLEGSRRFEALKLWMILRLLGRNGLRRLTMRTAELARAFALRLAGSGVFELVTHPDTNIVCFRPSGRNADEDPRRIRERLARSGGPLLSLTEVDGREALRAVISNPVLSDESMLASADEIARAAAGGCRAPPPRCAHRT